MEAQQAAQRVEVIVLRQRGGEMVEETKFITLPEIGQGPLTRGHLRRVNLILQAVLPAVCARAALSAIQP